MTVEAEHDGFLTGEPTMRIAALAGALLLVGSPAQADFGLFRRPVEVRHYYYVVPPARTVYTPWVVIEPPILVPAAPVVVPAAPRTPAPPSRGLLPQEPPRPQAGERQSLKPQTSFYEVIPGQMQNGATGHCSVAFWNLTSGNLTLRVEGQIYTLPRGRKTTLDLPGTFTWQVNSRDPETTTVPAGHASAEILIQR
jgi:hypothetical protein